MPYILPENTVVNIESIEDPTVDRNGRLRNDLRFEWVDKVATPAEAALHLLKFRRDGYHIVCDAQAVIEIKPGSNRIFPVSAGRSVCVAHFTSLSHGDTS